MTPHHDPNQTGSSSALSRRAFLAAGAAAFGSLAWPACKRSLTAPETRRNPLPRWRGFNLQTFYTRRAMQPFDESEFRWTAGWGFDFIRLPMSYLCWTSDDDPFALREEVLAELDRAVDYAARYDLHLCLNLHKAPGFSVDATWQDPFFDDLWTEPSAAQTLAFHWRTLARRYADVDADRLSFNPVNEPVWYGSTLGSDEAQAAYVDVMAQTVQAIHTESPHRPIVLDGLDYATQPSPQVVDRPLPQSMRGYMPTPLTHHRTSWTHYRDATEPPAWPLEVAPDEVWDRETLRHQWLEPWRPVLDARSGLHCGEMGAYRHTPHHVVLGWMEDVLTLLGEAEVGWALWNLRGGFGVLDSERSDVSYEDFHGHQLDRAMLELLRAH